MDVMLLVSTLPVSPAVVVEQYEMLYYTGVPCQVVRDQDKLSQSRLGSGSLVSVPECELDPIAPMTER